MTGRRIYSIFTAFLFCVCLVCAQSYGATDDIIPISVEKEKTTDASVAALVEEKHEEIDNPPLRTRFEEPEFAQPRSIMDDIMPISSEKEKAIGRSVAEQVEKQYKEVDDPLVQKRFEELGKRLVPVCDRQELVYHFKVLKAGEGEKENYYNAFALPGGYIYMFEPLMELMETDDKIAAVIAHELGHINARHSVKRLQGSLGVNALMLLSAVVSRDGRTVAEVNEAIGQLMMAYSREDEFEADRLSVKYTGKAGFNPQGVQDSLLTLKAWRKEGRERRYTDYKSHPYLSERISKARTGMHGHTDFDSYINLPEETSDF